MADQKVINFPDSKKEDWRPVPGYEGRYEISSRGRVKSISRTVRCKDGRIIPIKERILSPGDNGKGYLQVNLSKNNTQSVVHVHRLVAEVFVPNPKNKKTVNHKDGNKSNNSHENLEWLSYSENHNHAYKNNLMIHGDEHHFSTLTKVEVREIRERYKGDMRKRKSGITAKELAIEYGVSRSHILNIINRKKRKRVK